MKTFLMVLLSLGTLCAAQSKLPCARVWLNNSTVDTTATDKLITQTLTQRIKSHPNLCFMGSVSSGLEWQAASHHSNDVLLTYTSGALDDGNGIGPVGKHIDVIAYEIVTYDSKVSRIVSLGPSLEWFSLKDGYLSGHVFNSTTHIIMALAMCAMDGQATFALTGR